MLSRRVFPLAPAAACKQAVCFLSVNVYTATQILFPKRQKLFTNTWNAYNVKHYIRHLISFSHHLFGEFFIFPPLFSFSAEKYHLPLLYMRDPTGPSADHSVGSWIDRMQPIPWDRTGDSTFGHIGSARQLEMQVTSAQWEHAYAQRGCNVLRHKDQSTAIPNASMKFNTFRLGLCIYSSKISI